MTTTLQSHGGGAQPASIDTSGKVAGGTALRVYGFDTPEAAAAAGYVCEGGPAMSVALITDAQLASGTWKAEGDPSATIIYTAPSGTPVEGGYAVPVYPVNGWGSTPVTPGIPPLFVSAEVGNVDATTVVVTFDRDVLAAENDYLSGVTIKVNGSAATLISGIRQSNHAIVYYALTPAVISTDAVTWEYAEASGIIVSELDGAALADVTAQSVTNNVPSIGDTLRADAAAYYTLDEASGTRIDSKNSYNLASLSQTASEAGIISNGLSFTGVVNGEHAGYARYADADGHLSFGDTTFSVAFWIKVKTVGSSDLLFISYTNTNNIDVEWLIELSDYGGGTHAILFTSTFHNAESVHDDVDLIGIWHFVICEYNAVANELRIYFDNALDGTWPITNHNTQNSNRLSFGTGATFAGVDTVLDETLIIQRALTSDERAYLYNSGGSIAVSASMTGKP